MGDQAVTLNGTPAYGSGFAEVDVGGIIVCPGLTFSGSATGPRYAANTNGVIQTNGGGPNFFPGSSAGTNKQRPLFMMLRLAAFWLSVLLPSLAIAQNLPPQIPISELPPGGAVQSGDLFPANRAGVTYGVTWPPAVIPLTDLAPQTANILLGTISIGPPAALMMPSCSGATSALTWTTGVGPGCHSINATGIALSAITGAMGGNTIDNVNSPQTWTWNSLTTQTALSLSTSSEHRESF